MSTIQERLQIMMELTGTKQRDIVERLGMSSASVSNFCNGRNDPSNQTIIRIAEKFGVDEYWLRTGKGDPGVNKNLAAREEAVRMVAKAMKDEDPRLRDTLIELVRTTEPWVLQAGCKELIRWAHALEELEKTK